jgi:hypothetical protein
MRIGPVGQACAHAAVAAASSAASAILSADFIGFLLALVLSLGAQRRRK